MQPRTGRLIRNQQSDQQGGDPCQRFQDVISVKGDDVHIHQRRSPHRVQRKKRQAFGNHLEVCFTQKDGRTDQYGPGDPFHPSRGEREIKNGGQGGEPDSHEYQQREIQPEIQEVMKPGYQSVIGENNTGRYQYDLEGQQKPHSVITLLCK